MNGQPQLFEGYEPAVVVKELRWSDRRKHVEAPLFADYTFLRIVPTSLDRVRVLQTQGLVNFVGAHGAGIPTPEKQLEAIKTLMGCGIPYIERPFLCLDQRVRVGAEPCTRDGRRVAERDESQPGDFRVADSAVSVVSGSGLRSGSSLRQS